VLVGVAKVAGLIVGGVVINVVGRRLLNLAERRICAIEQIKEYHARISDVIRRARQLVRYAIAMGALLLAARAFTPPASVRTYGWIIASSIVALPAGLLLARIAHVVVDALYDFSDLLATVLTPFQYVKHMEHLAPLTKRCIEYFIYLGVSSWFLRQVNPALWLTNLADIAAQLVAIFFISRVVVEVLTFLINSFFLSGGDETSSGGDRSRQTLAPLIVSVLRYAVYFAAIVMTMGRIGTDPTPLLAGAGILGVTVGLGAQKLVSDLVFGFFIFFEGMFFVGDYMECADVEGCVEEVGVHITKVRGRGGVLHAIPHRRDPRRLQPLTGVRECGGIRDCGIRRRRATGDRNHRDRGTAGTPRSR
jgi:small conductance mechanosensitive channel